MAETPSQMVALGTQAPDFKLQAPLDDKTYSLRDFQDGKALLVMFICNHCPYVLHVKDEFARLEKDFAPRGLRMVAINSNSAQTHPQDGPANMRKLVQREGWKFPFLYDETQAVAKAYQAACTPDFFLYDAKQRLVYRGQLDDSRPGNGKPVTGKDLRDAIEATLSGTAVPAQQRPSVGCNIKWHPR